MPFNRSNFLPERMQQPNPEGNIGPVGQPYVILPSDRKATIFVTWPNNQNDIVQVDLSVQVKQPLDEAWQTLASLTANIGGPQPTQERFRPRVSLSSLENYSGYLLRVVCINTVAARFGLDFQVL